MMKSIALAIGLATALTSAASIEARQNYGGYGGYGGGYGGSNGNGNGGYDGSGSGRGAPFDVQYASRMRIAHAVLGALAYVVFFPSGAIALRLLPGKLSFWLHVLIQILAYVLVIAAFGLGVHLANTIPFDAYSEPHVIIGIIVFAFIMLQPFLGVLHHIFFKKTMKRTIWSHLHLWIGRIFITLGIINGGLGLKLADNTTGGEIAYGVVAGVIWLVWMSVAVLTEIRRLRHPRAAVAEAPPVYKEEHQGEHYARGDSTSQDSK